MHSSWQSMGAVRKPEFNKVRKHYKSKDGGTQEEMRLVPRGQCHMEGYLGGAGAAEVGQDALEIEREGKEHPGLTLFPSSNFLPISATL